MSHLHKEKERLRHQKQVKLLNKVMEYVPKVPNEPQSKVRCLRRLVLYVHYLQIIHKKLTRGFCTDTTAVENCVKSATTKPVSKPIKVSRQPKKKPRAHIVFLQADKSRNCTNNVMRSRAAHYNIQEVQSGDQESTSVLSSSYEYKASDVMSDGSRTNMLINQEDTFLFEDIDHLQHIEDFSVSSNNCELSSKSIIHDNENTYEDLDSNLSSKKLYCKEGHFLPIVANGEAFNSNVKESEEFSLYDVDKLAHSIVINDENLRASKHKLDNFHTHVTNDYDNNDLENFEFSSARNKNFKIPDLSNSDKGKEYVLNSYEFNIKNFNSDHESPSFTTKHLQNSSSDYSGWHNSDFSVNSESAPIYYDESFVIENNSISSTSTTRINIDLENLSDSSTFNNLSDSSNSQYNSYNSCINASYYPLNYVTKLEPLEMESDAFPLFLPNFSYIGNSSILMNEALIGQMYDTTLPQFSGFYPSRNNFSSSNSSAAFQPDSVNLFKNEVRQSENYKDFEFSCSPSLYNSIHSEQLSMPSPESKITNFNNPPGASTTENIKPALFEEEISYPLMDYMNNY